jgi:GNAT superfamily N-acetyltransferase
MPFQHHTPHLPLLLRTECIFLEQHAVFERVGGGWLMLSPNNPGYWWGNAIFMDHAPSPSDVMRWPEAFRQLVHARQPASRHIALGWEGEDAGSAQAFAACGFNFFAVTVLSATHVSNPFNRPAAPLELREFESEDWPKLVDLMVAERDAGTDESSYTEFTRLRAEHWRWLAGRDLGGWFGAFEGKSLIGGLGVFVEAEPDRTGRRLARFQQVLTARHWRGQGVASAMVSWASSQVALRHAPSEFLIQAVSGSPASLLYRRTGFKPISQAFGLELAKIPGLVAV